MKKILLIIIAVVALCACGDNRRVQSSEQSGESSEQQDSDTSPKDLAALQVAFAKSDKSIRDNSSRIDSMNLSLQNVNEKLDNKVEFNNVNFEYVENHRLCLVRSLCVVIDISSCCFDWHL